MAALLLDENIPRSTARILAAAGHDLLLASEHMEGADDADVVAVAREEGRVIVTFDADFGELVFRHRFPAPPGIIYLRLHPIDGVAAAAQIESALRTVPRGYFVVANGTSLRLRRLPVDASL